MRRTRTKKLHEEPLINLTPLIDVVFVILFTFIVVAPLLETDKIVLAPSAEGKERVSKQASVLIHVFSDNTISLNQKRISLESLPYQLALLKKKGGESKAQVFHDKSATFGTYQRIKNALESAGFKEMDVILQPQL